MHMREAARRMSVNEFITVCSWLDYHYGKEARTFEVLDLFRTQAGALTSIKVILGSKRILTITPEMIDKMANEVKKETRERASNSSA